MTMYIMTISCTSSNNTSTSTMTPSLTSKPKPN